MDDLSQLQQILGGLGLNIAASAIYDVAKRLILGRPVTERAQLEQSLSNEFPSIELDRMQVIASTVIPMLAKDGLIQIRGSSLYGPAGVSMRAEGTGVVDFGHDSVSRTDLTAIRAEGNASMKLNRGAEVRQNADGSISFATSNDGGMISFATGPGPKK